jgi:predicted esterase
MRPRRRRTGLVSVSLWHRGESGRFPPIRHPLGAAGFGWALLAWFALIAGWSGTARCEDAPSVVPASRSLGTTEVIPGSGPAGESPVPLPKGVRQHVFHDEAGEHRYLVYAPEGVGPAESVEASQDAKPLPVVLFLHGAGEKGNDGLRPLEYGLGVALEEHPTEGFIAVFPQCGDVEGRYLTGWQAGRPDATRALAILDEVERNYPVDPSRRVLCGWSMGGYGAWSLAADDPNRFSSVLAISGGAITEEMPLKNLARSGTPVWAIHGAEDTLVPVERAQRVVRQFHDAGGRGTLTVLEGIGHDVWRYAFAHEAVFDWMLAPDSIDPETVDWKYVTPLPPRSRFTLKHLTWKRRIANAVSLRLGNDALEGISAAIPDLIPESVLRGELPDIERRFQSGGEVAEVRLAKVRFRSAVSATSLRAVSGGRFRVRFDLHPLELTFGEGSLVSGEHRIAAEKLSVVMGHRRPVTLEAEVQPMVSETGLRLLPLRQSFRIPDDNWFIRPPETVVVDSPTLSREHAEIGIVGGLYLRRRELEEHVLGMVPSLLEIVEEELHGVPAPRLARLLWPLPALVPEIEVAPSRIRSDPRGLSLLLNVNVFSRNPGEDFRTAVPITIEEIEPDEALGVGLALDAVRGMSRLAIDDGLAHINVLDIPAERFADLADVTVMSRVFPELKKRESPLRLRTVLRLIKPFSLEVAGGGNGDTPLRLILHAPEAALDIREQTGASSVEGSRLSGESREPSELSTLAPLSGRFILSIRQPIQVTIERDAPGETAPGNDEGIDRWHSVPAVRSLHVRWEPQPEIELVRVEPLEGEIPDDADAQALIDIFTAAWVSWADQSGSQILGGDELQFGTTARLRLRSIRLDEDRLELRLDVSR